MVAIAVAISCPSCGSRRAWVMPNPHNPEDQGLCLACGWPPVAELPPIVEPPAPITGVYLIHFDRPLHHAQHYIGWSANIEARFRQHKRGVTGPYLAAVRRVGISICLVRTWIDGTREFEQHLKKHYKSARDLCPVCREARLKMKGARSYGEK